MRETASVRVSSFSEGTRAPAGDLLEDEVLHLQVARGGSLE